MEFHSWKDEGVPPQEAWTEDKEKVVVTTQKGNLTFVLYPVAAPKTVETFKKGIKEQLYTGCKFKRLSKLSTSFQCRNSRGKTKLPNLPSEWLHAPLKWMVGAAPVEPNMSDCSPYNFLVSTHDEQADFMAPGGSTTYGYSVFMKLKEGDLILRQLPHSSSLAVTEIKLVEK
eukprot:TRINITY_DN5757_c0_g2_i5.p1 TRINITY_DN5757_c0_g2~~TRINITY_DN5757_c0_g2_i5.p1  ORF type:complete len:172 (-),score=36.80 TRINITY_DN5757_c0_g2_i5:209-724(-)